MERVKIRRRTENVTIRFDVRLRYGLELATREQKRSVSSFIEWAVEKALSASESHSHGTIASLLDEVWDLDPADRVLKLAKADQRLLSHEERIILKAIEESPELFQLANKKAEKLDVKKIRRCWDQLELVGEGELGIEDLVDPGE